MSKRVDFCAWDTATIHYLFNFSFIFFFTYNIYILYLFLHFIILIHYDFRVSPFKRARAPRIKFMFYVSANESVTMSGVTIFGRATLITVYTCRQSRERYDTHVADAYARTSFGKLKLTRTNRYCCKRAVESRVQRVNAMRGRLCVVGVIIIWKLLRPLALCTCDLPGTRFCTSTREGHPSVCLIRRAVTTRRNFIGRELTFSFHRVPCIFVYAGRVP